MSARPLLEVRDLAVHFPARRGAWGRRAGIVRAVDGVSFDVAEGETLGLVGESGCGKSTAARAILRLVPATRGSVRLGGRDLLALGGDELRRARRDMQMIFQDPYASLDPRMTVEESVAEPLRVHRTVRSGGEARTEVTRLLEQVGLTADFAARYPHELSGGQRQRVGIARAIALKPKILFADEPVSALDVSVRAQIVELLSALQREHGVASVFVAHDLAVVRRLSHRVAVMYLGRIVEIAPAAELFTAPAHPYARALLAAVPSLDPAAARQRRRLVLAGEVPSPEAPPPGCAFHPRCPEAVVRCRTEAPALVEHTPGHAAACHLAAPSRS
jgi:oligopeptide/dipeptide ABC transporter ATP-binding protein